MEDKILSNLDNPGQLERLYRSDKPMFKRAFNSLYPKLSDNNLVGYWNERLNFADERIERGNSKDLLFVIVASLIAGIIAKFPVFLSIDEEYFYSRNVGFIVFPALCAFFAWKNKLATGKIFVIGLLFLAALFFINSLPDVKKSDTLVLSCIHLLPFMWSFTCYAFIGSVKNSYDKRIDFLKFNGDLIVITGLILISGAILSVLTVGLFSLIHLDIKKQYFEYVGVFGASAAPIVGTYLTHRNPQLVGKVSPLIAKIFSPLVLVMLVIYLVAMAYSGKDPYNDREFLLIFNSLLIGVLAIIFFSVAESSKEANKKEVVVLLLLSSVTVIVNCIALSAILFRISEWGFTPNRTAVLGSNVLVLINLLLVTIRLFKVLSGKSEINRVGKTIAGFLPVYFIWTVIVVFIFPLMFWFK